MSFSTATGQFIAAVREKAAGGLSFSETWYLFKLLIRIAVGEVTALAMPGGYGRLFVLVAVGTLFDVVAPVLPIPVPLQPFWVMSQPYVKQFILMLVGWLLSIKFLGGRLKWKRS